VGASFNDILIDCDCLDCPDCLEMKKEEMQGWDVLIMDYGLERYGGLKQGQRGNLGLRSSRFVVYHPSPPGFANCHHTSGSVSTTTIDRINMHSRIALFVALKNLESDLELLRSQDGSLIEPR